MLQILNTRFSEEPAAYPPKEITFTTLAETVTENNALDKHEYVVWKVASILFDPVRTSCASLIEGLSDDRIDELEHRIRRDALSDFWVDLVREDTATSARDAATAEEKAFAYLAGGNVEEACAALIDGRNDRLATIIAQLPGNSSMQQMMRKQIEAWRSQNILSEMSEPIRALYEVVAGHVCVSEGKTGAAEDRASTFSLSSRFGLDWRRSFGLRLWYGNHSTASLIDAVNAYSEDVASGKETVHPVSGFLEQEQAKGSVDTVSGLLKLYARKPSAESFSVGDLLSPANVTGDHLNARVAWQLATFLRCKEIVSPTDITDDTLDFLSNAFAYQLETVHEFVNAFKVLLHLKPQPIRDASVRSMLNRRAPELAASGPPDSLPDALTKTSRIPTSWLWHARALAARAVLKDHATEVTYLLRAGAYDEAHTVLCRVVAPQAVISRDTDRLRELLGEFEDLGPEVRVQGWVTGGRLFFDYIHLVDLQGRPGHAAVEERKRVLERLLEAMDEGSMRDGDLWEKVARVIIRRVVLGESDRLLSEEKYATHDSTQRERARMETGNSYASWSVDLSRNFYGAVRGTA